MIFSDGATTLITSSANVGRGYLGLWLLKCTALAPSLISLNLMKYRLNIGYYSCQRSCWLPWPSRNPERAPLPWRRERDVYSPSEVRGLQATKLQPPSALRTARRYPRLSCLAPTRSHSRRWKPLSRPTALPVCGTLVRGRSNPSLWTRSTNHCRQGAGRRRQCLKIPRRSDHRCRNNISRPFKEAAALATGRTSVVEVESERLSFEVGRKAE